MALDDWARGPKKGIAGQAPTSDGTGVGPTGMKAPKGAKATIGKNMQNWPVGLEKTEGGNYPIYKKDSKAAKSFNTAFGDASKAGKETFKWQDRDYTTEKKSSFNKSANIMNKLSEQLYTADGTPYKDQTYTVHDSTLQKNYNEALRRDEMNKYYDDEGYSKATQYSGALKGFDAWMKESNPGLEVNEKTPEVKGLKDMPFGSQARIDEYTKRNWKMDDTTHPKAKAGTEKKSSFNKAAHVMTKLGDGWGWNLLHGGLDLLGMVPLIGNVADVANAGIYTGRGQYGNAALSLAAAVPIAGYGASAVKGAKWGTKGYKAVKGTSKAAPALLKTQTKAGKIPFKTRMTQNVAESVSKLPLSVQKAIARSNKLTFDAAKTVGKIPVVGTAVRPIVRTGGKLGRSKVPATHFVSRNLIKPWVRYRGFDNVMQGGADAGVPGMDPLNRGYNATMEGIGTTLAYPINKVLEKSRDESYNQGAKDAEEKYRTEMDNILNGQYMEPADSTKVITNTSRTNANNPLPAYTDSVRSRSYQDLDNFLNSKK